MCRLPASRLRALFNDRHFFEDAQAGLLEVVVWSESTSSVPEDEPAGTVSQMLQYWRDGVEVALVHQYTRPDGTIGASGRPDPKKVIVDAKCYRLLRKGLGDADDGVAGGS